VQRILRHSDPRITTEVYRHLVPDYLRAEIDRLSFGIAPPTKPSNDSPTLGALSTGLATSVLQPPPIERSDEKIVPNASKDFEEFGEWARRDSNPLPPASELWKTGKQAVADASKGAKILHLFGASASGQLQQKAGFSHPFATSVLQAAVAKRAGGSGSAGPLLTVREVAERLRVCTATVYRLCESGRLWHLRVSNAVRVPEMALRAFMETTAGGA
jgi:excisionase family DNA binding protein